MTFVERVLPCLALACALAVPVSDAFAATPVVSVTASPTTAAYGASAMVNWAATGATVCSVPWGSSATSGSYLTPALFGNATYTITCYGPGGSNAGSATVTVGAPPPAPRVTLTADPSIVAFNGTTTLSWAASDATSCNTPWGATSASGVYVTPPVTYDRTYTVTCSGYGGSGVASVTVRVGTATPTPAPVVTLGANPASIAWGASTTLTWAATNASACVTPWGATAIAGSTTTAALTASTSYTVTCTGSGGTASATAAVSVAAAPPAPAPTVSLVATPPSIAYNATSTLSWSSTNATTCTTPWGATATSGSSTTPALAATTSYTVSCTGSGGTASAIAVVSVAAAPPATPAPTVSLAATPSSIAYGATSTLNWSSTNATACTTPWGATATSGSSTTPALTATTSYTVSCAGAGGSQSAQATVTVAPAPPPPSTGLPTVTLSATPGAVAYGGSTTLTWTSANASYCAVPWGSSATSGSYTTPALFSTASYALTCYGPAGTGSGSVVVAVGSPPPPPTVALTANPAIVAANATSTLVWSSTNATSCNTPWGATATAGSYTTPPITYDRSFTVTCSGYGGSNGTTVTVRIGVAAPPAPVPVPAVPTVALAANPASIAYGATTVLSWSSTNATACTTPWGATATAGSFTTAALTASASYAVSCTGAGGSAGATAAVTVAAQVADPQAPIVFNASGSARPGDVVSLQGDNFGEAPVVTLTSAPAAALEIVNRVGTGWLAVQIPADAQGALTVRIRNAAGTSAPVALNAARPLHLDAIQIVPGGAFRIFGRNLLLSGSVPIVRVNGVVAGVDLGRSDEHMLSVTAPAALAATASAAIVVDNGNGSGPVQLDRAIEVATPGSGDPFALGVGWAAGFADIATRSIDATSDARLSQKVVCDGSRDDSPAIQQAIQLAASLGGGVVKLPAGRCRVAGGMNMVSRVVVQGAGKAQTELVYASNYPVFGVGLDLVGIRNLTLTNAGSAVEGPLLKQGTRLFLQNVRVALGTSSQMYLDGNRNFVVAGCDFVQGGSISHQGPYILNDAAGLVFQGNTTQWVDGAPTFGRIHDSFVQGNRFTRNAASQSGGGTVHSMTIDFAHRIAVVGNTFDVANGPITNTARNDGETILTEAGGAQRTENLGSVTSAGAQTLTDTGNTLNADPFGNGYAPENYGIAIVAGKGAGQSRRVVSYAFPTAVLDRAWDVVPDATSRYASFVWGLEKSLIKNNTLAQNPRGIWLYQAAVRDVDVVGNTIGEGGGIYLRSYQNLGAKSFIPQWNVLIAGNTLSNTTGRWMSYINAVFVNSDARAFGIAALGIEMRANLVTANMPNVSSQSEEYANTEGLMNMMRVENFSGYESMAVPRMLGTIVQANRCTNCAVGVRVGTGAGGTTIIGTVLQNSAVPWSDSATTVTPEKSTATVVR